MYVTPILETGFLSDSHGIQQSEEVRCSDHAMQAQWVHHTWSSSRGLSSVPPHYDYGTGPLHKAMDVARGKGGRGEGGLAWYPPPASYKVLGSISLLSGRFKFHWGQGCSFGSDISP